MPAEADGVFSLLWLIIALPAIGAAVSAARRAPHGPLGPPARDRDADRVVRARRWSCSSQLLGRDERGPPGRPARCGPGSTSAGYTVHVGLLYDQLSALFVLLITGVGSLIHIYSIGYMAHDERRRRFFAYLNLFVAAMLMLVLADDYLVLFLGWEGVGLASYLLIGFWQHKTSAAAAAKKAFVVNRVGDLGMSLAIC